ncbi:DinB family protein [Longitalea luteola]|uniref:DinB family protein n=1 Tax=Longitalea luteola TaxID=2812563 RepID=UPI001A97039D|nr:DinB family protein [Longitalea luteola]
MSLSASVCSRLQHQHESILELLNGFSEDELKQRIHKDKWSAFEQLAHLVSYQPVFLQRMQKIQAENEPVFDRYKADDDPAFKACCRRSVAELLADLSGQRTSIIKHLMTLTGAAVNRTGRHPVYGLLTVTEWTEFFLLHEAHHIFSIFMLTRLSRQ